MSSVSTGVNVFHADWTVVVGSVGDTFVWHVFRKAEATDMTVDEFVPSSDPGIEIISITSTITSTLRREFLGPTAAPDSAVDTLHFTDVIITQISLGKQLSIKSININITLI